VAPLIQARAAALLACAFALAACTRVEQSAPGNEPPRNPWTIPGHVRIGTDDEPDNLNPMFAHSDATDQVDALIFAPMFRYDARGELVPELATEVPTYANGGISKDSRTIVLHFRHGVRWSDGAPLTARDLRFTYRAVMSPANNTKSTFGWDDIAAIDVPRDDTAIVRLRRPNADAIGLFATGSYPPLPEHLLASLPSLNRAAFNAHPISSGPFLLSAWRHGSSIEFVRNDRYWRGPSKVSAISMVFIPNADSLFTQLQTHEIDVVDPVPEERLSQLAAIRGITVRARLVANFRRLVMNCARPALSDARVRLAVAEAIDWDRMNATVFRGVNQRAVSDISPNSWAAPHIPPYRYDPPDARRLLDAAGWRAGPAGIRARNGTPLSLVLSATNKPFNEQSEVQMQQALRGVGVDLTIKNYPASYLFAQDGPLYSGRYDLEFSVDTNAPDPDNRGSWSGDFIPPKGANTTFLNDPIITQTSDAAIRTFDRARRKALYQREEERIHQLVPAVFFFWEVARAAYNSDLRNYQPAEYITSNWNAWEWQI
jgi:peptide/nickel transport system substrate-binding protein